MSEAELYQELIEMLDRGEPCATATITNSSGSIPNAVGATLLADARGQLVAGTVGGGEIEHRVLHACAEAIAGGASASHSFRLTDEQAGGIGMMCGGTARVFVQVHRAAPQLVLVGGGHINLELARFAERFGWNVTVIEDRPEWCTEQQYPEARRLQMQPAEGYGELRWTDDTYVVVATRNRDLDALAALAGRSFRYVGVVASKRKAVLLVRQLREAGVEVEPLLPRLHAPVGLDLGGRSPADVALSIIAELQAVRHQRSAKPLGVAAELDERLQRRRLEAAGGER